MKKFILTSLAVLTAATLYTSCNDMLDTDPRKTEVTDAVFPGKVADVESELSAIYSIMNTMGGGDSDNQNIFFWWEVMSDNCYGSGGLLEISYVGYATQVVPVNGRQLIAVVLEEDSEVLSDVVVIGYGVQKKKLVTGATVQVKGADLAKLNTTNPLEAMQSQTPGVQITQSSTQPGKGFNVVIRGKGTNRDTSPLYVIDGVIGSLDGINSADIESIDVLKDAASAAIYGARAANGVVLVTTKQGKSGKIELSYNGATGWSNVYKRPQLLNAQQYMTIMGVRRPGRRPRSTAQPDRDRSGYRHIPQLRARHLRVW